MLPINVLSIVSDCGCVSRTQDLVSFVAADRCSEFVIEDFVAYAFIHGCLYNNVLLVDADIGDSMMQIVL